MGYLGDTQIKNVVLSNMLFGFHNRRYACILVIKPLSTVILKTQSLIRGTKMVQDSSIFGQCIVKKKIKFNDN